MKASKKSVYYIEVVGRALDVLEVFLDEQNPQLSLKDIAGHLNQSMNTAFRLLYTLAEHGYIVKTNKMYRLGSKLLDLSNAELRNTDLVAITGPHMDALRERFGETVNLGVMLDAQIRYIDVRQSLERFRLAETVGDSDPLHCTALGKAILAFLPPSTAHQLLRARERRRVTEYTITSLSVMRTELQRTRERGYALDLQESTLGGFCIAVPILDETDHPVAAISIAGPYVRFNEAHVRAVVAALRDVAATVSAKLYAGRRGPARTARMPASPGGETARRATRPA